MSPASVWPLGAAARERARPEVRAIRKELAAWIREARERAGLSPREVARAMGYGSLERGMSRLARWERGEEGVWADRIPLLAAALGRNAEELARFGERELEVTRCAGEREQRTREGDWMAEETEEHLLGRHAGALIHRFAREKDLDSLPDVALWTAGWSIMMLGSGAFGLRTLVRAWQRDLLTQTCDCCSGPLRLFWVSGSPFSGANRLRGICQITGLCRNGTKPRGESLTELVWPTLERSSLPRLAPSEPDPGQALSRAVSNGEVHEASSIEHPAPLGQPRYDHEASSIEHPAPLGEPRYDLTLAEVCGIFGLQVPVVRIRDASDELMALFDPSAGVITPIGPSRNEAGAVAGSEADSTNSAGPEHLTLRVSQERGAAKESGGVVIGSLVPLSFGARGRSCQHLVDAEGRIWRLFAGHMEDAEGQAVAWFDGPVPPGVAGWVVTAVSTMGAR